MRPAAMRKRKASQQVTLVLSGALTLAAITGCDNASGPPDLAVSPLEDSGTYTNNTYHPDRGYYHAASHVWYPYAWGQRDPAHGYFYDGGWSSQPRSAPPALAASRPTGVAKAVPHSSSRGGFGSTSHSFGRSFLA
jgi:hypothetical protein